MKKITMIVILAFLAMTLSVYLIFSLQNSEVKKLDRPNILGLFGNYELVWNSVEHADYYEIKVNDDFYKNVTTNSYKFVSYQFMYTVDHFEPTRFTITAIDSDALYESNYDQKSITISQTITPIRMDLVDEDNAYHWEKSVSYDRFYNAKLLFTPPTTGVYEFNFFIDDTPYSPYFTYMVKDNNHSLMSSLGSTNRYEFYGESNTTYTLYFYDQGPMLDTIDIDIHLKHEINLNDPFSVTLLPNSGVSYRILNPSNTYLYEYETSDQNMFVSVGRSGFVTSIFHQDHIIYFSDDHLFPARTLTIYNPTIELQTYTMKPILSKDMNVNEDEIIPYVNTKYAYIIKNVPIRNGNLVIEYDKNDLDFDIVVYKVNAYYGHLDLDYETEYLDNDQYRITIPLTNNLYDMEYMIIIDEMNLRDDNYDDYSTLTYYYTEQK